MDFKYYKNLIDKDKAQALKELSNITDYELAVSLIKTCGSFVFDNLNDELKNNNEILKYVFKNFKDKSINIFKNMNEQKQELFFEFNPKSLYPYLKNENSSAIVSILLRNKLIDLLKEEQVRKNYDYITELILKDIRLLQQSKLHFNDNGVIIKVLDNYDLKDVRKIFIANNQHIISVALNYFNDKEKIKLFIKNNKKILLEFLSQNIIHIHLFRKYINTLDDFIELVKLNTSSMFFLKVMDEIIEQNTVLDNPIDLDCLIKTRTEYIYEHLNREDKAKIIREIVFIILTYNREKHFENTDLKENQTVISTILLLLLFCECKRQITVTELIEELKVKIKDILDRKKMSLPTEIFLTRIANKVIKLQKKSFFKNCSIEYLVLSMLMFDDDSNRVKEINTKDPFFTQHFFNTTLERVSKNFPYLKITDGVIDLDSSFLYAQNIQKMLNNVVWFNNVFLEQDYCHHINKSDLDIDSELDCRFEAILTTVIESFNNNRKELYKIDYLKQFLSILEYYDNVFLNFEPVELLCKMKC